MVRLQIQKTLENVDIALAIAGCILSIPLTVYLYISIHRILFICLGVICFLSFFCYLLIRLIRNNRKDLHPKVPPSVHLIINLVFIVLLLISIFTVYFRHHLYTRPLLYFIVIALIAAIISIEILFLRRSKSAQYIVLTKIIVLALSLQWSQSLVFPDVIGMDPWYHKHFAESILATGHTVTPLIYNSTPGFHLLVTTASLITGTSYKVASLLSVSLAQVLCDILFIFLLGKYLHSVKCGLLAALFLSFAVLHIQFGFWPIPNTMGVIFIPAIIYLIIKIRQQKSAPCMCAVAILMSALLLTHPTATVFLGGFLFLLWVGVTLYRKLKYPKPSTGNAILATAIVFTVAALSFWTFYSGHIDNVKRYIGGQISSDYSGSMLQDTVTWRQPPGMELSDTPLSIASSQYRDSISVTQQLLDSNLLIFIYFGIALTGSLVMVNKYSRNSHGFAYIVACLAILTFNIITVLTLRYFSVFRWAYFLQVVMAIPVGTAIIWITQSIKNGPNRVWLIATTTAILAFFSITTPRANIDNSTLTPDLTVRHAFTTSELTAAKTLQGIWTDGIGSDYHLSLLNVRWGEQPVFIDISEQLYNKNFYYENDALLLIREEIVEHPTYIRKGRYCFCYDPSPILRTQGYHLIYSNNSNEGFVKYLPLSDRP